MADNLIWNEKFRKDKIMIYHLLLLLFVTFNVGCLSRISLYLRVLCLSSFNSSKGDIASSWARGWQKVSWNIKKKLWGEKFNNDIFQLVTQRKSLIISFLRDSIQFPVVSWNERKKKYFHNFYRQVKNDTKFWLWFKKKKEKNNFVINHDGTYL